MSLKANTKIHEACESAPELQSQQERSLCDTILQTSEVDNPFFEIGDVTLFEGGEPGGTQHEGNSPQEGSTSAFLGPEPFLLDFPDFPELNQKVETSRAQEGQMMCVIDSAWKGSSTSMLPTTTTSTQPAESMLDSASGNLSSHETVPTDVQAFLGFETLLGSSTLTIDASPMQMSALENTSRPTHIGKLTVEERKRRVARYLDKKKRRVWGRKVEYQCRKTIAKKRVRVNGRFA